MKTPLTVCLLLWTTLCFGQVKFVHKTVQPALALRKNESHRVSILHSKTKTEDGGEPISSSLRYEALLTVLDSTADEFTLKWVYQLPKSAGQTAEMEAMRKYFEGLDLIYKTDGTGSLKELVNWEEARDFCFRMLEESIPKTPGDSTNESLEKTKALFSTKEMVQRALIKEIQLFHSVYGQSFSTRLEKSSTFMSVPIAEEPVPALVTAQVTDLHPAYYTVKTSQIIDKVGASKMFEQMFKKMGLTDEKTLKEARAELTSFQMSDTGSYTLNAKTGLPIKAVYKRTARATGNSQVETYELSTK